MDKKEFRLFDFHIDNVDNDDEEWGDQKKFTIKMFGINEKGDKTCIIIDDFEPYFFVKVANHWTQRHADSFMNHLKYKVGTYYKDSILQCVLVKRKTLYGFDANTKHKFICLKFKNTIVLNKTKKLWYKTTPKRNDDRWARRVLVHYPYSGFKTTIYESKLPPLLRFFHIYNISPSGWIALKDITAINFPVRFGRKTNCKYEYHIKSSNIIALPEKETPVPLKICSFDIEASSSHGDFPLPRKKYEKVTIDILNYLSQENITEESFRKIILTAFNYDTVEGIHNVYPVQPIRCEIVVRKIQKVLQSNIKEQSFLYYLNNKAISREEKYDQLTEKLFLLLPRLKGDEVTFIGSTFRRLGEDEPYLNHCIANGACDPVENVYFQEDCHSEQDILIYWAKLIQREDPDIIVGYNIFGFDYKFMIERAKELDTISQIYGDTYHSSSDDSISSNNSIKEQFMQLSRVHNHTCREIHKEIRIASGTHKWIYPEIIGRVQIDLYNHFRREYNLSSYKLDSVSHEFIGDSVKKIEYEKDMTKIYSGNLTGLHNGNYIVLEEITYSSDLYQNGQKFMVSDIDRDNSTFCLNGILTPNMKAKVRWCLAKDDITPKQIFEYSNGTKAQRALIAKYCIMDCNLVHHLMRKIDIITGYSEISNICSIPINFVVFRGQGIKLLSFIAKKCRELGTVMRTVEPIVSDGSYEGAICLPPKRNLYLDDPVAVC